MVKLPQKPRAVAAGIANAPIARLGLRRHYHRAVQKVQAEVVVLRIHGNVVPRLVARSLAADGLVKIDAVPKLFIIV